MTDDRDPRRILWTNISSLMQQRWLGENLTRLAREAKVGPGTVSRMKACETFLQLDTVAALAAVFDLAAWQVLVPGLEPGNPPALAVESPAERRLYKRFLEFKKSLETDSDEPVG
jgi:hypothetical protein